MSHNIEFVNGKASIAYAGELPWHGLGTAVEADLTPEQIMVASGTDWEVDLTPTFWEMNGVRRPTGQSVLYRTSDNRMMDVVSDNWKPVQNREAFNFFCEFVERGEMEMHTAGSLNNGKIVWALAKLKESFTVFGKKDQVDQYLLFTNPHQFGKAIDVRTTFIRVVCNNTLTAALEGSTNTQVSVSHRSIFDADVVKTKLGIAAEKRSQYEEMAKFLGSVKAKDEDIIQYFVRLFPNLTSREEKKELPSRNALIANGILDNQPGHDFGAGTWWQPFNAVTFMTNHVLGRTNNTRLASTWYGSNRNLNARALNLAVEMAEASR